ncbi:MAG: toll/interleukin-1 receptor domain-containing protein [Planctomycetes bacterium]|nr:toll/interleukin-1 receptor domain-containing protein [Planctomycetota bacterium]
MNTIFFSYRRSDTQSIVGRIHDRLSISFPKVRLFRDVDSIPIAADFRGEIEKYIRISEIVLIVIGPDWLAKDASGGRRIDDPRDFVRAEIASALALNKTVIPLLVEGASMPAAADLPADIEKLAFRNALQVRTDPDFKVDIQRLIDYLRLSYPNEPKSHVGKFAIFTALFIGALISCIMVTHIPCRIRGRTCHDTVVTTTSTTTGNSTDGTTAGTAGTTTGATTNGTTTGTSAGTIGATTGSTTGGSTTGSTAGSTTGSTTSSTTGGTTGSTSGGTMGEVLPPFHIVLDTFYVNAVTDTYHGDELRFTIIVDGTELKVTHPHKTSNGRSCMKFKSEENWSMDLPLTFHKSIEFHAVELNMVFDDSKVFDLVIDRDTRQKGTAEYSSRYFKGRYKLIWHWVEAKSNTSVTPPAIPAPQK